MVNEKIKQAVGILQELDIDMWLTFTRETSSTPDPALEMILGTGVVWPSAFFITAKGDKIAVVGSLDVQNIKDHATYNVTGYVDSIRKTLIEILDAEKPGRIAVNYSVNDVLADGMTHGLYLLLTEYLADTPYLGRLESSEKIMAALRGRKSATEQARILGAVEETQKIFEEVTAFVRIGHTEKDVADFIRGRMKAKGLEPAWDPEQCPSVFTGPESAGAHAGPTGRAIEPGHIMNIDFGVRKDGYVSDLQRTWYALAPGEKAPPESVKRGFTVVRDAVRKAAEFLKPGLEGWTVDKVARKHIVDAGFTEYPHALGHQVGRKAHDGSALLCPKWERYKDLPFLKTEAGQVYTLEPRLTVEGHGVATVEEIAVVERDGCRFLSTPQNELFLIKGKRHSARSRGKSRKTGRKTKS